MGYTNSKLSSNSITVMKTLRFYFILLLSTYSISLFSQLGDCTGALLLDTKDDVVFTFASGENQLSDVLTPLCTDADIVFTEDDGLFTHWFTWQIKESGTLYFTLSMETEEYDIDFIVYRSEFASSSCANKQAIRCMFSGENIGFPSDPCLFETGLNSTDLDLFENGGCNNGDNNFLQKIDAIAGEEYKLLVIDFAQNEGINTLLELCGTATLGIDDSPCFTLDTDELTQANRLSVFPNPANDQLFISNNNVPVAINFPFTVMDQMGRVLIQKNDNTTLRSIETATLTPGIYFIRIHERASNRVLKFVKG